MCAGHSEQAEACGLQHCWPHICRHAVGTCIFTGADVSQLVLVPTRLLLQTLLFLISVAHHGRICLKLLYQCTHTRQGFLIDTPEIGSDILWL